MKKVVVASENKVKIAAVLEGLQRMFPGEPFDVCGVSVPSGVGEQPRSDAETLAGARNRVDAASVATPEADFWIGLEGGVEVVMDSTSSPQVGEEMVAFGWVVAKSSDGRYGKGRTGTFFLPPKVAELVMSGTTLGEADDRVFGRSNSGMHNGAVGLLTGDAVVRTKLFSEAVILALIPFKHPELY